MIRRLTQLTATAAVLSYLSAAPALAMTAWAVVPDETTVGFSAVDAGYPFTGEFEAYEADILFDPANLDASKVTVRIDLESASTGAPDRDGSLPSGTWFDVKNHPTATYEASQFKATGEGAYVAKGTLTLKGVTKPVDLPFTLKIDGNTAHVNGETALDRTTFNVGEGEYASGETISKEVKVLIDLTAVRAE
mgnify:CR=1 FL=1